MKTKLVIVFFLLVVFLTACSSPVLLSGTVVEKVHEPEVRSTQWVMFSGSESMRLIPITQYDDEDFLLKVKNDQGEESWVSVSSEVWDKTQIGDHFTEEEK